MSTYMAGTLVRETGTFFDLNGEAADPEDAILQYQVAAGTEVTQVSYSAGQVTRLAQGVYYYDIDTTGWAGPGTTLYVAQWQGTGPVQACGPDYFEVLPPAVVPP